MYQNFDALDVKQARKLGLASALGQLFDHGCDCCMSSVYLLNIVIMFKLGQHPCVLVLFLVCVHIIFYAPNWAEFFTHILRTNNNNMDVTEIHFVMITLNLLTGIFGEGIWHQSYFGLSFPTLISIFISVSVGLNCGPLILEAWDAAKDKQLFYRMTIPIITYFFAILLTIVLLPDYFKSATATKVLLFCFVFNVISIKLITGSLTRMTYSTFHWEIAGLYLTIVLLKLGFSECLICLMTLVMLARLIQLALSIIIDISTYLKINVLWVPK